MIKTPAFLLIGDKQYLVSITRNNGKIIEVDGPYQAVGQPNETIEQFIKGWLDIMHRARHLTKPLQLSDLPEEVQDHIRLQINETTPTDKIPDES